MSIRLITLVFALTALGACASGTLHVLIGGAEAPNLAGTLEVWSESNGSELEITLDFAPPPEAIAAGLSHYVAWALPASGRAERMAALAYDGKSRRATARTSGPRLPYSVLVTAETDASPTSPSEYVVLEKALAAE